MKPLGGWTGVGYMLGIDALCRWSVVLCWTVDWTSLQGTIITGCTCMLVTGRHCWTFHYQSIPCWIATNKCCQ